MNNERNMNISSEKLLGKNNPIGCLYLYNRDKKEKEMVATPLPPNWDRRQRLKLMLRNALQVLRKYLLQTVKILQYPHL